MNHFSKFTLLLASMITTAIAGPTISLTDVVPGWASRPVAALPSGTTGGKGGTTVTVTNMADLTKYATASSPMIILVEPGTYTGTLAPAANKTIVGKAPGVLLKGNVSISGTTKFNIVLRNMTLRGNVCNSYNECKAGVDAMAVENGAHHIWLDHIDIADGQDGNCDFTKAADYITASWMKFSYTYAKEHRFSNLISSSDASTEDRGKLQITYMNSWWADRVNQRQPRGRFGKVHLLNNLFGSQDAGQIVSGPGVEASYVIEGNYYNVPAGTQAVKIYDVSAVVRATGNSGTATGMNTNVGTAFTIPYKYTALASSQVKTAVTATIGGAGNTVTLSMGGTSSVVVSSSSVAPSSSSVANKAPVISLTAPTANASYTFGAVTTFTATASDPDGTVSKVVFIARAANTTTLITACTDVTSPYSCTWKAPTATTYNIYALAIDNKNDSTKSNSVNISILVPASSSSVAPSSSSVAPSSSSVVNKVPVVSLTAPTANASYTLGATTTFTATASDPDGTVSKVVFIARAANTTTLITACTDVTSPYSCTWKAPTATTYNIYALAIDNKNDSTKSNSVNISILVPASSSSIAISSSSIVIVRSSSSTALPSSSSSPRR